MSVLTQAPSIRSSPPWRWPGSLVVVSVLVALVASLPVMSVVSAVVLPDEVPGTWAHVVNTVLADYVVNTLVLALGVSLGTLALGVGSAWLVVSYRFPGRRLLDVLLVLPLAFPAYVMAYAYTDLLDHAGWVQSTLRAVMGWGPRAYWFPEIRSTGGAVAMLSLVLYPYVYLLARASLLAQAGSAAEAARTLGRSQMGAMVRVSLPLARPAIATGVALALMETLADYGTVSYFGVHTFTTGIYRAYFSQGDAIAAAKLAASLLAFVALLLALERWQRGQARYDQRRGRFLTPSVPRLRGWRAMAAVLACALPVGLGFALPFLLLIAMAVDVWTPARGAALGDLAVNSFTLASLGAILTVAAALCLAYAVRSHGSWITRLSARLATLGYATPGSIIAIGILVPLTTLDRGVRDMLLATTGYDVGLLLTGSLAAMLFAYMVRFLAVALFTVESALSSVTPSMDEAARTLGQTKGGTLLRVHLPLIRGGLLTALLIVFVDIMKELPASLMLRRFNFDTLAIQAHNFAADERLAQAALPSLAIVVVGLVPVILLNARVRRKG